MRLDGHIILLNWNSSSTALLRHIASAYAVSGCATAFASSLTEAAVGVIEALRSCAQLDCRLSKRVRGPQHNPISCSASGMRYRQRVTHCCTTPALVDTADRRGHYACTLMQEGGMFNNRAMWPWNNRPPVVILADKPKVEMDLAVHEMLK